LPCGVPGIGYDRYTVGYLIGIAAAVVDLQLAVDVGLVHEAVEHVEHGVHVPHLK
jgi:hypothetical protein